MRKRRQEPLFCDSLRRAARRQEAEPKKGGGRKGRKHNVRWSSQKQFEAGLLEVVVTGQRFRDPVPHDDKRKSAKTTFIAGPENATCYFSISHVLDPSSGSATPLRPAARHETVSKIKLTDEVSECTLTICHHEKGPHEDSLENVE